MVCLLAFSRLWKEAFGPIWNGTDEGKIQMTERWVNLWLDLLKVFGKNPLLNNGIIKEEKKVEEIKKKKFRVVSILQRKFN